MSTPKGYSSQEKEDRLSAQFQTVEPVRELQFGSSVVSHQYVYEVATDAVEAGTTAAVLVATGHSALKGDVVRITSGTLAGYEAKVWSVAANSITLAETLPDAPGAGDTIQILRHKYPLVTAAGETIATLIEVATAASGDPIPAVLKVAGGYDGFVVTPLKTDAAGELQVDVLSSALPDGAATSAVQTDGSQKTQIVDGSGNVIGSTGNALDVNLKTPITVDVSLSQANDSVAVFGSDGTVNRALKTDSSGQLQVDVLSSALPSGAATADKQDSEIALLTTIAVDAHVVAECVDGTELQVDVVSSALPAGASTYAAQTDGSQKSQIVDSTGEIVEVKALNVALAGTDKGLVTNTIIHGETTGGGGGYVDVKVSPSGALTTESTLAGLDAAVLGQETMANSLPVVLASDQTTIPVTVSQADDSIAVYGNDGTTNRVLKTDASGELQIDVLSSALPSGAATESTLGGIKTAVELIDNAISGNEMQVDIVASLPAGTATIGKVDVNTLSVVDLLDAGILDTSSTNIAGSASSPTQVVASTAAATKKLQILDTTGAFIGLYTGAVASEMLKLVIGPGSDQTIEHSIPASTRVSLKRLDSTTAVSSGIVAINFIG